MKKTVRSIMLFFAAVCLIAGCTTSSAKYVPDWARQKPEDAAGVENLVQRLERGEKVVFTFTCFSSSSFQVEMRGDNGYFTVAVDAVDAKGRLVTGDAYFERNDYYNMGILRGIVSGSKDTLNYVKMIIVNMDAGMAATLTGKRIPPGNEDDQYDVKRFDQDSVYRKGIFEKWGITPYQMSKILQAFYGAKGKEPPESIFTQEAVAGTQNWTNLDMQMKKYLKESHELWNGKNYLSKMSLPQFQIEATRPESFTAWQRFCEQIRLPLALLPVAFTPIGGASLGAGIVSNTTNSIIRDDWTGPYARATVKRMDLSDQFEWQDYKCHNLIDVRDEEIKYLKHLLKTNNIKY